MVETPRLFVVRIAVADLFGKYSYELAPRAPSDSLSQLLILYGENGTGKTTILLLLNHLLSKKDGEGHRTFLARTQFTNISAYLNDGTVLSATRPKPTVGNFTMTMVKAGAKTEYEYLVNEKGAISFVSPNADGHAAHEAFRLALPDLQLTFLADDRKISKASGGSKLTQRAKRLGMPLPDGADDDPSALKPALDALREWARSRAIEGSNVGQRDVNHVYIDLLRQISLATEYKEPLGELFERLGAQGVRSAKFSRFALTTEIDVDSIIKIISHSSQARQHLMAQVIMPYLDSNEARFAALDSLQKTLATFVDELNARFLKDKNVSFDLGRGVRVYSGEQVLDPRILSSGEKQLLVLFCDVAQASDQHAIFIIDEPELSLNVDWQRHLINALQKLGSENVQFILATHSLELLARHRDNVAKLTDKGAAHGDPPVTTEGAEG